MNKMREKAILFHTKNGKKTSYLLKEEKKERKDLDIR